MPNERMAQKFSQAERGRAFEAITTRAEAASLLAFCQRGVAVLRLPGSSQTDANLIEEWDAIISAARRTDLAKFAVDGIAVLDVRL